jgi:hypothetical protein
MVYFSLVQSVIQYSILVWGSAYFEHMDKLFKVQKLTLGIMGNKPHIFPSVQLFGEFKVLSIRQLYIEKLVTFVKKSTGS